MRIPRLLFVGAFPPPKRQIFGGNVTACRALLESSLPQRIDLIPLDSTQVTNPAPVLFIRLLLAIRRLISFVYLFETKKPDAVLLFSGSGAGLLEKGVMARYTRARKKPAFIFPRGGGLLKTYDANKRVPNWVAFSFKKATKILCQGTAMQNYAIEALGRTREEAVIVPNWTATPSLLNIGEKRKYEILFDCNSTTKINLLFVGWLEKEKGIEELFIAFCHLVKSYRLCLEVVGDGKFRGWAEKFINDHNLNSCMRIRGWLSGSAIEDAYQKADIFVLPSWVEGLPNAIIEAMAAGLCVVASSVGNIPDVIHSKKNGILVVAKNKDSLIDGLRLAIEDSSLRCLLAKTAHVEARASFNVERAVDRLMAEMFSAYTL